MIKITLFSSKTSSTWLLLLLYLMLTFPNFTTQLMQDQNRLFTRIYNSVSMIYITLNINETKINKKQITSTKPTWCKYVVQRRQSHSGFHLRIFVLKDSNDELILIVSGTLLLILGVIYETVSVPCLTVLGFVE